MAAAISNKAFPSSCTVAPEHSPTAVQQSRTLMTRLISDGFVNEDVDAKWLTVCCVGEERGVPMHF